jgi:hypothetical protein
VLQTNGPLVVLEPVGFVDALHAFGVEQVIPPLFREATTARFQT